MQPDSIPLDPTQGADGDGFLFFFFSFLFEFPIFVSSLILPSLMLYLVILARLLVLKSYHAVFHALDTHLIFNHVMFFGYLHQYPIEDLHQQFIAT